MFFHFVTISFIISVNSLQINNSFSNTSNPILVIPFKPLDNNSSSLITIDLQFTTKNGDNITRPFLVDTSSFYLTIFPSLSSELDYNETRNESSTYTYGTLNGTISTLNSFFIPSTIEYFKDFSALIVNKTANFDSFPKNIYGIFGLGFNYEDYFKTNVNTSFIEKLYQNGFIKERIFKINYTDYNANEGNIIVGNVTEYKEDSNIKHGSCRVLRITEVIEHLPYWQCSLEHIKINYFSYNTFNNLTKSFLLNTPIRFDSSYDNIIVPKEYFDQIVEATIGSNKENFCKIIDSNGKYSLVCQQTVFANINEISFTFNPTSLKIQSHELFYHTKLDDEKHNMQFIIQGEQNSDKFLFGQNILKKFNVQYDKNNEKIFFENEEGDLVDLTRDIYYLIFFICLVGIGCLMFIGIIWYFVLSCVESLPKTKKKRMGMKKKKQEMLFNELYT